ncbi:hypothetical protein COTS27_01501 [Spirochaetota bacterium]|nr:hypothetical protein COTS27_01501 [Spirochaetota bacterium]
MNMKGQILVNDQSVIKNALISLKPQWLTMIQATLLKIKAKHLDFALLKNSSPLEDSGFEEEDEFDESVIDDDSVDLEEDFSDATDEAEDSDFDDDGDDASSNDDDDDDFEDSDDFASDYDDDIEEENLSKSDIENKDKLEEDSYENVDDFIDTDSSGADDENGYFYGDYEE